MKKIFKKIIILFFTVLFVLPSFNANAYVSVKGYYKKNGTYVAPHVRSNPNGVKYDNYGYTPSQGLYNDTYGTRGATWDTPTYVTDPNYYVGKNLYDSNQADTYSSLSYTPVSAPSCPSMSSYDSTSKTCKCYSGYSVGTDLLGKEACVSNTSKCQKLNGSNSTYNSLTGNCECSYGYIYNGKECVSNSAYCRDLIGLMSSYNSLSKKCECMSGYELVDSTCTYKSNYSYTPSDSTQNNNDRTADTCVENSSMYTDGKCHCNDGYEVDLTKANCIKKTCPLNSDLYFDKCLCGEGLVMRNNKCLTYAEDCKQSFGDNVYGTKKDETTSNCYCNGGYEWDVNKKFCKIVEFRKQYLSTKMVVNIREYAGATYRIIGKTSQNIKYEITDLSDKEWVKIKNTNGVEGYILKKLVVVY